ncbi:putative immunity protein [Luteococcus sp. H138]|uniref:putative immunity protein n=1 Tax=unclassified Luteococcus TaxID=2639923 RepID=UPI00313AA8DC
MWAPWVDAPAFRPGRAYRARSEVSSRGWWRTDIGRSGDSSRGDHALGAAAYAVKAVSLTRGADAVDDEVAWQISHLTPEQRRALALLPEVGCSEPGPLGPGLLSRGFLGDVVRRIQTSIAGE